MGCCRAPAGRAVALLLTATPPPAARAAAARPAGALAAGCSQSPAARWPPLLLRRCRCCCFWVRHRPQPRLPVLCVLCAWWCGCAGAEEPTSPHAQRGAAARAQRRRSARISRPHISPSAPGEALPGTSTSAGTSRPCCKSQARLNSERGRQSWQKCQSICSRTQTLVVFCSIGHAWIACMYQKIQRRRLWMSM